MRKLIYLSFCAAFLISCMGTECIGGGCDGVDTTNQWIPKKYEYSQLGAVPEKQQSRAFIIPKDFNVPNGWRIFDQTPETMSFEILGERLTSAQFYTKYPDTEYDLLQNGYSASVYAVLDDKIKNGADIKAIVIVTKN